MTTREGDIANKNVALRIVEVVDDTVGEAAMVCNTSVQGKVDNGLTCWFTITEVQSFDGEILTTNLQARLSVDDNLSCMESLDDDGLFGCALCLPFQRHIRICTVGYLDTITRLCCLQTLSHLTQTHGIILSKDCCWQHDRCQQHYPYHLCGSHLIIRI